MLANPSKGAATLGRISKRGSKYLRTLFIQAANVILMRPHNWELQLRSMAAERSSSAAPQQTGNSSGLQAGEDRMEHLA